MDEQELNRKLAEWAGFKERENRWHFELQEKILDWVAPVVKNNGNRIIAKTDAYCETKTPRDVSPEKLRVIEEARAFADEWVTLMRLEHILSDNYLELSMENIGKVIPLMIEDITREAEGEIINSPDAREEIGRQTALLIKGKLSAKINEVESDIELV